jgi:aspartate racemase
MSDPTLSGNFTPQDASPRPIGILGGMGPQATILLQKKLLGAVQADDDSGHIPLLIDMNTQVPSRIDHLIHGRGEDPAPVLAAMARRLQGAGAEALAMPCNTAHHYAPAITSAVSVPFLDMVDRAAERARRVLGPQGCVGMLASPAVRMTGLFDKALEQRGLRTLWPADEPAMLGAIRRIKADGPGKEVRGVLRAASDELADRGALFQFVACTEFSLIVDCAAAHASVVDTMDVLVDAIADFSLNPGPLEHA